MPVDYNLKIKNLAWNFVIYKVGNNYWLTNPKVGTRFLTNFSQINGNTIYYSFTATPFVNTNSENIKFDGLHDTNGFIDSDTIHSYNRVLWKIKGTDYNKEPLEDINITDILSKVTHTIIRNPIERLKSGIIQILVEWFFETRQYFLRNESWSHVNMFDDYSKQNNYNVNWNTFYRIFDDDLLNSYDLNLDIINRNHNKVSAEWVREWKRFTEVFLHDVMLTKFFEYNIDTNVHTQAFLHSQYNFLHDIGVYHNISVVDLSELNTKRDLLLDGHPLKESLVNHFDSPLIRETNDIFKTINWDSLYKWVENSKVYAYELHAYYTMLNRKK
jgi:hypothetical protein